MNKNLDFQLCARLLHLATEAHCWILILIQCSKLSRCFSLGCIIAIPSTAIWFFTTLGLTETCRFSYSKGNIKEKSLDFTSLILKG